MNRRSSILTILIITVITLVLGNFALTIGMDPDFSILIPKNSDQMKSLKKDLNVTEELTQYIFLAVESADNFTVERLNKYKQVIDQISALPEIKRTISPFNFITFIGEGKKIIPQKLMTEKQFTSTRQAESFKTKLLNNPLAQNFVVAEEGHLLNTAFANTRITDIGAFMNHLQELTGRLDGYFTVHLTGEVPLNYHTGFYLKKDLRILLSLSIIVMMFIFFISFRTLRAVVLTLLVIGIGMIWTTGFMALAGYKYTLVSVTIPTLLLAVGSSYTIHLLNEYYRNAHPGETKNKVWLETTLSHVKKTIIIASLTTIIGFLSLFVSSVVPIREFGLSISIGITATAILSLTFLPAVFLLLPQPHEKSRKTVKDGLLTRLTMKIAVISIHHPLKVIASAIMLVVIAALLYPTIIRKTNYLSYYPQNDPIVRDTKLVIEKTGGSQTVNITLKAPDGEKDYFLRPDVIQEVEKIENVLKENRDILSILSFNTVIRSMNKAITGEEKIPERKGMILLLSRYFRMVSKNSFSLGDQANLISRDGSILTLFTKVYDADSHEFLAGEANIRFLDNLSRELGKVIPKGMGVQLWGSSVVYQTTNRILNRDQMRATILSLFLILIVTSAALKNFIRGLLSIVPIVMGITMYYIVLEVFRIPLDMTTILVTNVAIGVGVDNAVHFLLQYNRQRLMHPGEKVRQILLTTMGVAGRPVILTTLALMAGLLVLTFASFAPIDNFGLLTALTLFSAMVGTVFLLPALIVVFTKEE